MIHAAAHRCADRIGNKGLLENIRFLAVCRVPLWQLESLPTTALRETRYFSAKGFGVLYSSLNRLFEGYGEWKPFEIGTALCSCESFKFPTTAASAQTDTLQPVPRRGCASTSSNGAREFKRTRAGDNCLDLRDSNIAVTGWRAGYFRFIVQPHAGWTLD